MKKKLKYTVEESAQGGWSVWYEPEPRAMLIATCKTRKEAKTMANELNSQLTDVCEKH